MRLVRLVKAGFSYNTLVRFQKATALSWEKIAEFVQIPQRTIARRQSEGRLRPDESDRVLRAATVFEKVVGLFEGNADAARQWLQNPQRAFGGETPLNLASTEIGARQVEDLIGRLEHGVFT
jgi:putative toxin-antitoxin system antitoxin component (TIGR02293 family)